MAPSSPDLPPPADSAPAPAPFAAAADDDDDDDPYLIRTLKLRSMAVSMAGGEEKWDLLDDDTMRKYLDNAEMLYDEAEE